MSVEYPKSEIQHWDKYISSAAMDKFIRIVNESILATFLSSFLMQASFIPLRGVMVVGEIEGWCLSSRDMIRYWKYICKQWPGILKY